MSEPPGVRSPFIVGIGGSSRSVSSTELCLRAVLREAAALGAKTRLFDGRFLSALPHYGTARGGRSKPVSLLVESVRAAEGVVVASPGYHGGISGLVKNGLDHLEELQDAEMPYLEGRAVGCIATASGWQAGVNTLAALRSVVHALRGWPTPLGLVVNTADAQLQSAEGRFDERTSEALRLIARQVVTFHLSNTDSSRDSAALL